MVKIVTERNGYRLRDYVICKWAKNKEILGVIIAFNDNNKVLVEMLIGDKKSENIVKQLHEFEFSEIKPRDSFSLQYGLLDE